MLQFPDYIRKTNNSQKDKQNKCFDEEIIFMNYKCLKPNRCHLYLFSY